MPKCRDCEETFGFLKMVGGRCEKCHLAYLSGMAAGNGGERLAQIEAAKQEAVEADRRVIDAVMITTETAAPDLKIASRLGIVTAECAFGMNLFKDIFAAGRDFFGGRSATIQDTLKDARNTALDELRLEASKLGADAVIAVSLNYSEISGGGKSMLFLVATGTAVRLG